MSYRAKPRQGSNLRLAIQGVDPPAFVPSALRDKFIAGMIRIGKDVIPASIRAALNTLYNVTASISSSQCA
ncbi:hypothetical protein ACVUF4_03325, partial [Salmonella enterica subsp. enterica serovar Typhimurium]